METPETTTGIVPDIRQRIELAVLSVEPGIDLEAVQMAWTILRALKEFVRDNEERLKKRTILYIKANGAFMIGDERFYVGAEKETKCIDVKGATMALLGATGEIIDPASGEVLDFERLVDCLSSNAFKPATAVKALGAASANFFETKMKDKLKRDGKEWSELQSINTRFLK